MNENKIVFYFYKCKIYLKNDWQNFRQAIYYEIRTTVFEKYTYKVYFSNTVFCLKNYNIVMSLNKRLFLGNVHLLSKLMFIEKIIREK